MNSEIQYGSCSSCGGAVAYKINLVGTDVVVNAQHVDLNLDCDKPYPKGQEVSGAVDNTVYPVQVIGIGMLVAVPPGNVGSNVDGGEGSIAVQEMDALLTKLGYEYAGHYTFNNVGAFQLPERVYPLQGCPAGTKFYSINGPVHKSRKA